jgi:hypothetical protein
MNNNKMDRLVMHPNASKVAAFSDRYSSMKKLLSPDIIISSAD